MIDYNQISNATFSKRFRGYDVLEVYKYLDQIQTVVVTKDAKIVELEKELEQTKTKLKEKDSKLEDYKKIENALKASLISGKRIADKMIKDANEKCDEKLKQTTATAQAIVIENNKKVVQLRNDYNLWLNRYNRAIDTYKSLLNAQLNLISHEEFNIEKFGLPDPMELCSSGVFDVEVKNHVDIEEHIKIKEKIS